mgnify:CR=1 FL=1
MMDAINHYLTVRRVCGFVLSNDEVLLRSYATFAARRHEKHVNASTAIEWAGLGPSIAQRDTRLRTVCRFSRFIRLDDNAHQLPPARHFSHHKKRRLPYIYSDTELAQLIQAALELDTRDALRPRTYATLIALLAVTGLRISEAINLRLSEVTTEGLVISKTKFHKSRLVPLHESAALGLDRYLRFRSRWNACDDHVFIDDGGKELSYGVVYRMFQKLLNAAQLSSPSERPRPRLHDLRHRFAVRALQASPQNCASVSQHMLALSTYLGHVNIDATYWYLEATPELLRDICSTCETFYAGGAS